jgi:N4 gp30-like protein
MMQIINNKGAIIGQQINLGNIDNLNIDDLFKDNVNMKDKIKAEIVAHSKRANTGEEIITYKLTFPRIILSEVNTYKMLEKNTSSSRAIPFEKMVEVVDKEPFVPLAFQTHHKGMQGTEYITNREEIDYLEVKWLIAKDTAVESAYQLYNNGITKQLTNRILEPFMWVTQLCTGTRESFKHLFEQRCPIYDISNDVLRLAGSDTKTSFKSKKEVIKKFPQLSKKDDLWWLQRNKGQAEIHFMDLAEKMYDALNESTPVIMNDDEWHIPFSERPEFIPEMSLKDKIMLSCAMTARVSYTTINDDDVLTLEKAKNIYDKCVESGHFSVVSHCAKCMTDYEYDTWIKGKCEKSEKLNILAIPNEAKGFNKNLRGFVSLRQYIEDKSDFNYE